MKELFRYNYFNGARVTLEKSLRRLRLANFVANNFLRTYYDFLQGNCTILQINKTFFFLLKKVYALYIFVNYAFGVCIYKDDDQ